MNDKAGPLRLGQKPLPKMRSVLRSTDKRSSSARAWSGGGQEGGVGGSLLGAGEPAGRIPIIHEEHESTTGTYGNRGQQRECGGSAEWTGGMGGRTGRRDKGLTRINAVKQRQIRKIQL